MSAVKVVTIRVNCDSCGGAMDNERPTKLRVGTQFATVDLCEACEARAFEALHALVSEGWKESGATAGPSQGSAVRVWAVENKLIPAGQRGRLPQSVIDAYAAAHQN